MKYVILIVVIVICILAKPWELSFAGDISNSIDSIQKLRFNTHVLLPANQVINNSDSELPQTQKLDRTIERFLSQWDIKGASFALMKDDKLIYSKGYGYADKELNEPTEVRHIFRVASISKLITAVGIMKLVEEGKLQLDDCVFGETGILNDSCFLDIKDPRSRKITVEHLLRHQAGYSVAYGDPMFCSVDVAQKMNVPAPADLTSTIRFVLSRRLRYTPGGSTLYSNIGYGILSLVIEKISGKEYEKYIKEDILYPAGCRDMHLGKNLYEDKHQHEVKYYETDQADLIIACDGSDRMVRRCYGGNNIEGLYGAGGWIASPTELLRFLAVIDGDNHIPDILRPTSIARMTEYTSNTLPLGWINTNQEGDWMRTGTLSGTSALMKRQSNGYSWVFITNTSSWKGSKFTHEINGMITRALTTVSQWPDRDLFERQNFDHRSLLVVR